MPEYKITWVTDEQVGISNFVCDCGEAVNRESIDIYDGLRCPSCERAYKLNMDISIIERPIK